MGNKRCVAKEAPGTCSPAEQKSREDFNTPGRIRTCNPRFRRPMRYPVAPRVQNLPIVKSYRSILRIIANPQSLLKGFPSKSLANPVAVDSIETKIHSTLEKSIPKRDSCGRPSGKREVSGLVHSQPAKSGNLIGYSGAANAQSIRLLCGSYPSSRPEWVG